MGKRLVRVQQKLFGTNRNGLSEKKNIEKKIIRSEYLG